MTKTRPDFESLWIGAHYSYGQWVWMATGSVLNSLTSESGYPPWRFGRPEKNDGCLLLDRHIENNSTFVETTCDRKRDFVCEECKLKIIFIFLLIVFSFNNFFIFLFQDSDDDEDDWLDEPVKFSHDNSTYIIYPIHKTWQDSQDFCRERGSVLAHVDNINSINLIIEAMGDHPREISHVWLGGIYSKKIDEWRWIHNNKKIIKQRDEFGYPPWAQIASEMESDTTDNSMCLNLDRSDHVKPHFYGLDCKSQQPFVCKISKILIINVL